MKYHLTEASSLAGLSGSGWAVLYFTTRDRDSVYVDSIHRSARDAKERFLELRESEGTNIDLVVVAPVFPHE